jgi:chromate transporter
MSSPAGGSGAPPAVSFAEALRLWLKVGLLGFGGPAGQIALMHRLLVEEKRWIGEARFLHALNYCMLLPGPEAQQLAIYVGWLLHRTRGGIVAGTLFVLPGFLAILALSLLYARFHQVALVAALFYGLKPAVLAVVVHAVHRLARRALAGPALLAVAALAFLAIFLLDLPFPLVVLAAALAGALGERLAPGSFRARPAAPSGDGAARPVDALLEGAAPDHARPSPARAAGVLCLWGGLWLAPVVAIRLLLGPDSVFTDIAVFFSKMAVVTFGGAYAVLAYVAQEAVNHYGWLGPGEMLDGLGLAETTPGPLILVMEFVGFLAGYRAATGLPPLLAGTLAALLTVWVTFVPCFLWIFLGAPYVERLRRSQALGAALSAVTGAVVGVVLNLAVWFALHVLFARVGEWRGHGLRLPLPDPASLDPLALALAAAALVALFGLRLGMVATLAASALAGALLHGLR